MKKWPLLMLFILSLFFISCSGNELTGGTTADVSTLTVIVRNENGSLMYGAEVYINGELKGKTNQYGELRGTREVVLQSGDNSVKVQAVGYLAVEPAIISGEGIGQRVTFTLKRPKTDYALRVYDEEGALAEVSVFLYQAGNSEPWHATATDEAGIAAFKQLPDGEYIVELRKGFYQEEKFGLNISRSKTGGNYRTAVTLQREVELLVEVVGEDGTPLPGAEVSLYEESDYNSPGAYPLSAKFTKEDGKVYFRNVEHDERYVVDVRREGFVAGRENFEFTPSHDVVEVELAVNTD